MKYIITLLMILITNVCFGASAQVNNIAQGGFNPGAAIPAITSPVGDLRKITLTNGSNSTTNTTGYFRLASMASPGGQYQVAGTGSLECYGISYATNSAEYFLFGYGDTAVTDDDPSAPTTPIYFGVSSDPTKAFNYNSGGLQTLVSRPMHMRFPANKYPFMRISATAGSQFYIQLECIQL